MLRLYLWGEPLLFLLLRALALVSKKFSGILEAREGLLPRWRAAQGKLGEHPVWVHVSSVGELEQARPVMERLEAAGHPVALSFFSTSVPKLVKDWSFVRHADYLPLDRPAEMEEMFALIRPKALILIRYDLWPHHVLAARRAGVPVILVNASTPPIGWFGQLSLYLRRPLFDAIDSWTFVDAAAAAAWEPYLNRPARALVAGDPRVDRALQRAEGRRGGQQAREALALWKRAGFCLVAGSTWPPDDQVLLDAWRELAGPKSLILVPHEPDPDALERLIGELKLRKLAFVRLSELRAESSAPVLLVDRRGLLAELYALADLAYVGGGFTRHIHSIIEPVAHGKLVAFGPRFARSPEAFTLWAAGAACALRGPGKARQLIDWIRRMRERPQERQRAEESLKVFLRMHRGAGERVGGFIDARLRSFPPRTGRG